NLTYRSSGRNFNPVMAMAAALPIAQVMHIRELGEIVPENVHTPGIFVQRVLRIDRGPDWA
ncbi:MAG: 3-oxoadipate CoA-transferase, partial [Roseomonas sp.]|nr:3-oxoadipate CoA-transferase [Roseomonas sp.]